MNALWIHAPVYRIGYIERRHVSVCQRNGWMLMDSLPWGWESKSRKFWKECDYRAAICKQKKWWRSTCLASGLALIWHSRPLSVLNIEQRWSSAAMRGAEHCARRTWWQLVPIPNPHSHVDVDHALSLFWDDLPNKRIVLSSCLPHLLNTDHHSVLVVSCSDAGDLSSCWCWFSCSSHLLNIRLHWSPPKSGGILFCC